MTERQDRKKNLWDEEEEQDYKRLAVNTVNKSSV